MIARKADVTAGLVACPPKTGPRIMRVLRLRIGESRTYAQVGQLTDPPAEACGGAGLLRRRIQFIARLCVAKRL